MEAEYVAHGLVNLIYTVCPERIVVGGGIAQRLDWTYLRHRIRQLLGNYLDLREMTNGIDDYVVRPALGDRSGLTGALLLAQSCLEHPPQRRSEIY
jgi:fructokinase